MGGSSQRGPPPFCGFKRLPKGKPDVGGYPTETPPNHGTECEEFTNPYDWEGEINQLQFMNQEVLFGFNWDFMTFGGGRQQSWQWTGGLTPGKQSCKALSAAMIGGHTHRNLFTQQKPKGKISFRLAVASGKLWGPNRMTLGASVAF